jgi:Spy/CpxP family protein refolding chaperone
MARLAACILALFVCAPAALALAAPQALGLTAADHALTAATDNVDQDRGQKPHGDTPSDGKGPRDRWKWWLYDRADLGITDKQSAEIDKIFETTVQGQRARREELERMETVLSTLTTENKADVAAVTQQVDKVESLRAEINKTRTVMLYRINLLLNADQRVKLKALIDKRDAERRKHPDERRR